MSNAVATEVAAPVVGMLVVVATDIPLYLQDFIKSTLGAYRTLQIASVRELDQSKRDHRERTGRERWVVSLECDGRLRTDPWLRAWGPKPQDYQEKPAEYSWYLLQQA